MSSLISDVIEETADVKRLLGHPFYSFEPWDVGERPEWMIELAADDGVNLNDSMLIQKIGKAPHTFQSGLIRDDYRIRVGLACTQGGKTIAAVVAGIIALTGEIPIAFRYARGEKTGYKRPLNTDNIVRWGRRDIETGDVIDHDLYAERDGTWDCGEITGAGKIPKELICPYPDGRVWIGCMSEHKHQTWIPKLKKFIPEHCLEQSKEKQSVNEREGIIRLVGGKEFNIITYEQDYKRFESLKVWMIILDEEPLTEKIYDACLGHCFYMIMTFTPYNGITFTKERVFDKAAVLKSMKIYHATQYDCPFHDNDSIEENMAGAPPWERVPRIWGLHSEQSGAPYFDRKKANYMRAFVEPVWKYGHFEPGFSPEKSTDLIAGEVVLHEDKNVDDWRVWEIYEPVKEGEAYFLTCDTARGAEDPRDAKDRSVAYVFRATENGKKMDKPEMVAALRSRSEVHQFRWMCLYACGYYNNAMLAPESKSETGATFVALTRDWPFYYKMILINDESERPTERLGFDTNARTRGPSINEIRVELAEADKKDHGFRHAYLLKEIAEAVTGDGGRCDHTKHGTTDCIIAYAVSRWVWKTAKHQVQCNVAGKKSKKSSWQIRRDSVKRKTKDSGMPKIGYGGR
jgi:hypothetical protein